MSETIILKTKKELEIFMNPTRQELFRELERAGEPVTPKYLSDRMNISPSSVQFHIKKLMEIGLITLDHTEMIRGIQAKFYRLTDTEVSILDSETPHRKEWELVMENSFMNVYKGFLDMTHKHPHITLENWKEYGSRMNGIVFLSEEDAETMFTMIQDFIRIHGKKEPGTSPWEYGIIAYNTEK